MKSALAWKRFYVEERERLGEDSLLALLDRAPRIELPAGGALVFPHTRLEASGGLIAAAATAVVRSGCDELLALGVLHGGREVDAPQVARARAGDPAAVAALRRVHGPGAPGDDGRWTEEFSLDNFAAFLALAARRAGRVPPRIIARYPFLAGDHPDDLPGFDELRRLAGRVLIVATADVIHHGLGYGTAPVDCRTRTDPATLTWARATIEDGLVLLASRDYGAFLRHSTAVRSDFRDAGPALAAILDGALEARVRELVLVDYSEVLGAPEPTWVAAAVSTIAPRGR